MSTMVFALLIGGAEALALDGQAIRPSRARAAGPQMKDAPWKSINEANKMTVVKKGQKPLLRGQKLTPAALEVTSRFKKEYPAKELEVLWAALLKCYGSRELAEEAARTNPQILNPSYSFCNTMLSSIVFGKE